MFIVLDRYVGKVVGYCYLYLGKLDIVAEVICKLKVAAR